MLKKASSLWLPSSSVDQEAFSLLSTSLQRICGTVTLPQDNGIAIAERISNGEPIFGASDASFKHGKVTHQRGTDWGDCPCDYGKAIYATPLSSC